MALIIKVDNSDFRNAFVNANRGDQFSSSALDALFNYYEETTEGSDQELDVIAICCDWSEYTAEELINEYSEHTAKDGVITDPDLDDEDGETNYDTDDYYQEVLAETIEHCEYSHTFIKVDDDCYLVAS